MKIARSLASIVAGYAVMAGILRVVGPAPPGFNMNYFLYSALCTIGAAIVGGFAAAWLAGAREIPHAAGVGFLMIVSGIVSMRQRGISQPGWYETTVAGCGPVAAMFGAALRMLSKGRPKSDTSAE